MRLFENLQSPFIPNRRKAYLLSCTLIAISIASLAIRGLDVGIDFKGGMEFVAETDANLDAGSVRDVMSAALGSNVEAKSFDSGSLLIRTSTTGELEETKAAVLTALTTAYPDANPRIEKYYSVGPRFANDLRDGALKSIFGSLLVVFIYIWFRFEWQYGVGAVAALFHDVTITLGLFSILYGIVPFSLQIDQALIAAFLTIVGYSLNDTVVIFDRIREYANVFKTEPFDDTVNRSINRTMSRTIVTSGTTLIVVIILFIFGGAVLKGFALALITGVLIGTYSSIFVASPIVVDLQRRFPVRR